jgi:hypothetical protein
MINRRTVCRSFAVILAVVFTSALVHAAEPVALRVVFVEVTDADAYVKEIERGKALMKRMESPGTIRVWKARFAGREAGSVAVAIEFPNMTELAKAEARLAADPEWMAWLKGLDKVRKVVSDSVYYELKP